VCVPQIGPYEARYAELQVNVDGLHRQARRKYDSAVQLLVSAGLRHVGAHAVRERPSDARVLIYDAPLLMRCASLNAADRQAELSSAVQAVQ
jgi:hypothetical protein